MLYTIFSKNFKRYNNIMFAVPVTKYILGKSKTSGVTRVYVMFHEVIILLLSSAYSYALIYLDIEFLNFLLLLRRVYSGIERFVLYTFDLFQKAFVSNSGSFQACHFSHVCTCVFWNKRKITKTLFLPNVEVW